MTIINTIMIIDITAPHDCAFGDGEPDKTPDGAVSVALRCDSG
ncbi:MAG: hypothetical protein Q8L30_02245 [bacterium]|nr:hypothetical protein [bacterium]